MTKIQLSFASSIVWLYRKEDAMVFMCTKSQKNIISTSGGRLESLQNHCPLFISGFAEKDEEKKNTNNLDICGSSSLAG